MCLPSDHSEVAEDAAFCSSPRGAFVLTFFLGSAPRAASGVHPRTGPADRTRADLWGRSRARQAGGLSDQLAVL
jgi:hypothetical protein